MRWFDSTLPPTSQNVAQSVRAPVLYTGGHRFDSCHSDFCKYRRCCLESEPPTETAQIKEIQITLLADKVNVKLPNGEIKDISEI